MIKCSYFLLTILFVSFSNFEYQNINEYKIDNNALKNHSEIEIICTHGGENIMNDHEYYYQNIAIDKITKDTITILTEKIVVLDLIDMKSLQFVSQYSNEKTDLLILALNNNDDLSGTGNINSIEQKKYTVLDKVAVNKKFKRYDGTKYPTVIGLIIQSGDNLPQQ